MGHFIAEADDSLGRLVTTPRDSPIDVRLGDCPDPIGASLMGLGDLADPRVDLALGKRSTLGVQLSLDLGKRLAQTA